MSELVVFTFDELKTIIELLLNYQVYQLLFFIPIMVLIIVVVKKIL